MQSQFSTSSVSNRNIQHPVNCLRCGAEGRKRCSWSIRARP